MACSPIGMRIFGKLSGLDFGLQYQAKREGYDPDKENGEGYGYSLSYQIAQGLTLTGAYSNSRRTQKQNTLESEGRNMLKRGGLVDSILLIIYT